MLFSRDDIDYLIAAFKDDLDAEVFPKGGFVAPTAAQESSGYRVWTDRRGERLAGKFVSQTGKTVTIEVGGENKTFPFNGLSQDDKNHINSQQQQNQQQGAGQPVAAAGAGAGAGGGFPGAGGMPPGFGPSGIGARPFGPMPPSGFQNPAMANPGLHNPPIHNPPIHNSPMPNPTMPSHAPPAAGLASANAGAGGGNPWSVPNAGIPQYEFKCNNCNRTWTGSSPVSECQNCRNTYQFHCNRCGHSWTRQNQQTDQCPKCSGGTSRVRVPGVLIGKVLAGICALLGIGYGATKARGEG